MDEKDFSLEDILSEVSQKKAEVSENDDLISDSEQAEEIQSDNDGGIKLAEQTQTDSEEISEEEIEDTPVKESPNEDKVKDIPVKETPNEEKSENIPVKQMPEREVPIKKKPVQQKTKKAVKKKKKKKKKSRFNGSIFGGLILVTIILTVSMLLAVNGISIGMEYWGIGKNDNDISFNIPAGSDTEQIADILVENGVINNKKLFVLAVKLQKPDTIYPGDITLQPSMGYSDIIDALAQMRESYESVTVMFTEGETLLDIANKLEENGVCSADDFLFEFNKNQDFDFEKKLTNLENTFYSREGYFFPDTYDFYVGDTANNVTRIVREHFEEKITDNMYDKMERLGLDLNEVITLASIVQLEAENVDEMPRVASVFLNRLDDSDTFPKLQSNTTDKYIRQVIETQGDNQASIAHYTEYYDTYECTGLPAGPICNPGLDAINAVLNAEKTDYYYFCNNLETGETFYAKTLEEHEENLVKAGLAE